MYGNLCIELRKKNIAQKAVSELIGCTERTMTNKLNGTTDFTISEAFLIHKNLLPEFSMDYIFEVTSAPA